MKRLLRATLRILSLRNLKAVSKGTVAILLTLSVCNVFYDHEDTIFSYVSKKAFQPFASRGSGSAFLVMNKNGKTFMITNHHVCAGISFKHPGKDDKFVSLRKSNDTERVTIRKIIIADMKADVCVLEAREGEEGLELTTDIKKNQTVYIVGHPIGLPLQLSKGKIIDKFEVPIDHGNFPFDSYVVYHDAINVNILSAPGNSGSPVVDAAGRVVGILFAGSGRYAAASFIIPSEQIANIIDKL